jgi:hypothetical protein
VHALTRTLGSGLLALCVVVQAVRAAGPPVWLQVSGALGPAADKTLHETAARFRSVVQPLSNPRQLGTSPTAAAAAERARAIGQALERARAREGEALWDECVREVAGAMADATALLAARNEWNLLRDLHVQAGVCMSLAGQPSGAQLHFVAATLLDESEPARGLHREEAERVQLEARRDVLSRPRGAVHVITEPPGAHVFLDGRPVDGTTPLALSARLGDHFVSVQRFRYETNTEVRLLQPSASVRINLEPARRDTLAAQLAALGQAGAEHPSEQELTLARAGYARAEQVIFAAPGAQDGVALSLLDVASGRTLRTLQGGHADHEALRKALCDLLHERCDPPKKIPWYVWPLAGAVVAAGAVTAIVLLQNDRDTRFCPPSGCR